MTLSHYLADEQATQQLAEVFAAYVTSPALLTFSGEVGAGKTTFIRALLKKLGVPGAVKSPTFSLIESYQLPNLHIHHFDLYRIHDEMELEYIGFRDYFTPEAICCVEWPERAPHIVKPVDVAITLSREQDGRRIQFAAHSQSGVEIVGQFQRAF